MAGHPSAANNVMNNSKSFPPFLEPKINLASLAAQASLFLPGFALAIGLLATASIKPTGPSAAPGNFEAGFIVAGICAGLIAAGLLCALYAMRGSRRHKRRGDIFTRALVGVTINGVWLLLLAATIPAVVQARNSAKTPVTAPTPAPVSIQH